MGHHSIKVQFLPVFSEAHTSTSFQRIHTSSYAFLGKHQKPLCSCRQFWPYKPNSGATFLKKFFTDTTTFRDFFSLGSFLIDSFLQEYTCTFSSCNSQITTSCLYSSFMIFEIIKSFGMLFLSYQWHLEDVTILIWEVTNFMNFFPSDDCFSPQGF